ncbi:MAG TPA: hypothetical protein VD790_07800 [Thermoleophilaceae bacterium]|nr:hypothetical protein [Thermoleophilaceae bacterium]
MSHAHAPAPEGGGWLTFAAVLFIAAAAFNGIYGVAALANDDYFAADELLFGDLSMWGVMYLALAAAQVAAGLLILGRRGFGVYLGIMLAVLHATVALLSIAAYPVWTVVVLVIDGMIIYGLTVYGLAEE